MVRRTFLFSSALVAAFTVALSATPVFAGLATRPAALTAPSLQTLGQPHSQTNARTLSATAVPAGSTPSLLQSQNGIGEQAAIAAAGAGQSAVTTPADPSIAVGSSYVVEAVNSAVEVTTRAGASPTALPISAMIKNTAGWDVRYPRVVYDPASGLFILTVLQLNPTLSQCGSQVAVMVSQSNPMLAWTARGSISIDPELGGGMELSNVSLALTANLVVESSDYVSCSTGLPVASQTTIIQRSDLVTGKLGVNSSAFLVPGPIGLQPAMAVTAQSVAYEVANDVNCTASASASVAVIAITGTPEGRNVAHTCTAEPVAATSVPPAALQGATSATLTTGDDRFLSAFWQGNDLWVAGNTGCKPGGDSSVRSCLNVLSIPATSAGSVGVPVAYPESVSGAYLFDPAIALDVSGDSIVTFDESTSTTFESVMVAAITGGVWSSPTTLRTSKTFYSPGACTTCTWGDYSAAAQDASHPTDVWVTSEEIDTNATCTNASSCWNTFIGRYTFAGPTISALSPAAGPASGGDLVTVFGSDFAQDSALTFNGSTVAFTPGSLTPDSFTFTTPSSSTSGLVQAQVTDSLGTSPITTGSGYIYVGLANYVPLTPFRILDTRPAPQCVQCGPDPTFGPNTTRKVQLTGVTGPSIGSDPIPTNATAVVLNVTEVAGNANSLLTVYPFGTGMPKASNLNFAPGKVIANLVTVTLGQGGAVNIFNAAGTVNVLADVEGYFAPQPSTDVTGEFHPIAPVRVCDTRSTVSTTFCRHGVLGAGAAMIVKVTGVGSGAIPDNGSAAAVVVNITGVAGTASTYITLSPTRSNGQCAATGTSTINLAAGVVAANRVMVDLGPASAGGALTSLCVFNAAGSINVVIDANGWFGNSGAAAGAQYQGIQPTRICDTRLSATSCPQGSIPAPHSALVGVAGRDGIPAATASHPPVAVIANLTAIAPTQATYLVMYAANLAKAPGSSDINLSTGEVLPNLVVVQLDPVAGADQGDVDLFNAAGSVNAVVDIEGWFQ